MTLLALLILASVVLDLVLGDPRISFHPVRIIGKLIKITEITVRRTGQRLDESGQGVVCWLTVISLVVLLVSLCYLFINQGHKTVQLIFYMLLFYFAIALKDLIKHSMAVAVLLQKENIAQARKKLSLLVSRDTSCLDLSQITGACIESIAENFVDGILAPIFWLFTGGTLFYLVGGDQLYGALLLCYIFKAISTMDSMLGYKNDEYRYFGWWAAKADDFANYVPARIGAAILLTTGLLRGYVSEQTLKIYLRDRRKSSSPNSGHPEAAVAAMLFIQLGGNAFYHGQVVHNPTLCGEGNKPEPKDIARTNKLVAWATGLLVLLLFLASFSY